MTIFEILTDVIVHKNGTLDEREDFDKVMNNFIILRYLSMDEMLSTKLTKVLPTLNKTQSICSKKAFYKLLVNMIPRKDKAFIEYIKNAKKTVEI